LAQKGKVALDLLNHVLAYPRAIHLLLQSVGLGAALFQVVLEVGQAQLGLLRCAESIVDLGLALRLLTPDAVNLICVSLQLKLNFLKSPMVLGRIQLLGFNLQKSLFQ
jgi:hypothetical protein